MMKILRKEEQNTMNLKEFYNSNIEQIENKVILF